MFFLNSVLYMIPKKLLINLRIIGKLQKNGRVSRSLNGVISLENDGLLQCVKRTLHGDSRIQTLREITSIIDDCDAQFNNMYNSKFMTSLYSDECFNIHEELALMITELDSAKQGIENLKFTYISDINTASELDIILLRVTHILRDANYKYNIITSTRSINSTSNVNVDPNTLL